MIPVASSRAFPTATVVAALALLTACGGDGAGNRGARNTPPTAAFTVLPDTGVAPLVVAFDASSSADADGDIAVYTWDFGDQSSPAMTARVEHLYPTPGMFTVTLTVTDNKGAFAKVHQTLIVMSSVAATHYSVTEIPSLGGANTRPLAINNHGHVVGAGSFDESKIGHAFLYSDGVTHDLGAIIGRPSGAVAINDSGDVAGNYETSTAVRCFHYRNGTMRDLGTLGGPSCIAEDMNSAGDIVGMSTNPEGQGFGFVWQDGTMTSLGTLGGEFSWATAINGKGEIVGYSDGVFLFADGQMKAVDMPDIWRVCPCFTLEALNDVGDIVGTCPGPYGFENQDPVGYLYRNGTTTLLVPPEDRSEAHDINNAGVAVGRAYSEDVSGAFVWDEFHGMQELNDLIDPTLELRISEATAINDLGQVVGYGYRVGDYDWIVAVLLTPTGYE